MSQLLPKLSTYSIALGIVLKGVLMYHHDDELEPGEAMYLKGLAKLRTGEDLFRHMQEYFRETLEDNLEADIVNIEPKKLTIGGPINGYDGYETCLHTFEVLPKGKIRYSSVMVHPSDPNNKKTPKKKKISTKTYKNIDEAIEDEFGDSPSHDKSEYEPERRSFVGL